MNSLKIYFSFFYQQLGLKIYLLFFLAFLAAVFEVVSIAFFIPLLAGTDSNSDLNNLFIQIFSILNIPYEINYILITIFLLILLRSLFLIIEGALRGRILASSLIKIRNFIFKDIFKLKYLDFIGFSSGHINNVIITELQKLIFSFKMLISLIIFFIFSISYFVVPAIINPILAFTPIILVILIFPFIRSLNLATKNVSLLTTKFSANVQSKLLQSISNFKYLKSTNVQNYVVSKLKKDNKKLGDLQFKESLLQSISQFAFEPFLVLIVIGIIFYSLNYQEIQISEIIILIAMVVNSLRKLLGMQQNYRKILNSWGSINIVKKLISDLNNKKEHFTKNTKSSLSSYFDEITFNHVYFSYDNNKEVLKDISFKIKKGDSIGLVGESGSGKSTIVNLLIGLISPSKGEIFLGSQNFRDINLNSFRSNIGYVTQENVIFNDTIKNNILLWNNLNNSNTLLIDACKKANIYDFIVSLPNKFDTILEESGSNISGGQRQRICIAREFVRDNSLIVFDEATSALDSTNERQIIDSINNIKGDKSTIIISHRISSVINCDFILMIKNGNIIEHGNFDELLKSKKDFYNLYRMQNSKNE